MTAKNNKRKLYSNSYINFESLILFQRSDFPILVNVGVGKAKVLELNIT